MSTIDLHSLYRDRAIRKARTFLTRGGGAGPMGGGPNGTSSHGMSRSPSGYGGGGGGMQTAALNAEVNRRDDQGRTVLHLAASELGEWALECIELLLALPGLQVNAVDRESGWSALHRALYAGNIAAARLLLTRDDLDARLNDNEGLSPFDVYNSTVDGTNPSDTSSSSNPGRLELYTWGQNRNFVLGFSGDGDRAYPERVQLKREEGGQGLGAFEPLRVKDVSMARLHTGIVTDERRSNVRLCGYGTGGRLGRSNHTQFTFAPLADFPHQASSVVLSPDHTVVVTTSGDVFTFGLNRFGQLGYALDAPSPNPASRPANASADEPIQFLPRRVVGALKKEVVLGAAASRTHTAVFTADGLFTWGTNKGQLGYPAAGTTVQVMPRKVTIVSQPIVMLTATENATACLLETKDVVVLYHEGYIKISFPLTPFPSKMQAYRPPQVGAKPSIRKIASCGNTFVALSSLGDVFSFSLDSASSTPIDSPSTLARAAPKPQRIWSLRRKFTAVTDVGVGLDGTIILCTVSGHVFVRTKKFDASAGKSTANPAASGSRGGGGGWKFARVPYLQRVIKVAANSTGAFAALRADVPLRFVDIEGPTLAQNLLGILPHWRRVGPLGARLGSHKAAGEGEDEDDAAEREADASIQRDIEVSLRLLQVLEKWEEDWSDALAGSDAFVVAGGRRFPVHSLVLSSRSPVLARRLSVDPTQDITLDCSDFTALLLLHYLYSDDLPPIWDTRVGSALQDGKALQGISIAQVKAELRRLAGELQLSALADSLEFQVKTIPTPTLAAHLGALLPTASPVSSLPSPDIILELGDREVKCHSVILRARCSFFETFYEDTDWTALRRDDEQGAVRVDLCHISWDVMSLVLEHIYRDAGMSLFQTVDRATADEYIDFVTQVLAASNELLLDKLKQVCSAVLRSFVTLHNVCSILVDAAFYEAVDLARACMYFLASSMETVLEGRLLDDLPPDLITALATFCQERQGAKSPISRSGLLVQDLMIKHANWIAELDVGRPTGGAKKWKPHISSSNSPRPSPSLLSPGPSPSLQPRLSPRLSPNSSPSLRPLREDSDEPFEMDEDFALDSASPSRPSFSTAGGASQAGPSGTRRKSSIVAMGSSPAAPSFTQLGSPPPPRLQPWSAAASSASKTPFDLRSIMASEAATVPRPVRNAPTPTRTEPSAPAFVLSSPAIASAGSWRPLVPSRGPSLADIQSEQALRAARAETPRPITRHPSAPAVTPAPPAARPNAPASPAPASVAPVYTPTRLAPNSRTVSGSRTTPKGGFGSADVPWTNYTLAPVSPPVHDPFVASSSTPPSGGASFAAIQSQQRAEVAAIKEVKAPRSFAEVMAREREEAKAREEEQRRIEEELEFARWFEEESKRVQSMVNAPAFVPRSAGPSEASGSRGGRGGRGGARGGGRGGKKSNAGTPTPQSASDGAVTPQAKGKSPRRGRGRGGSRAPEVKT